MRRWNETCLRKQRGRGAPGGYVLAGALLVLLIGASRRLPAYFLSWQDEQQLGRKETWQVKEVTLTAQESLSLTEKLEIPFHPSANFLLLENGRHYTQETIGERVRAELKKLGELGILTECHWEELRVRGEVNFYINTEDSEKSVMLWTGEAVGEEIYFSWAMDDESGKLVRVGQELSNTSAVVYDSRTGDTYEMYSWAFGEELSEMTEKHLWEIMQTWGTYLGCELEDAAFQVRVEGEILGEEFLRRLRSRMAELEAKGYSSQEAFYMVINEEEDRELQELKYVGVFRDAGGSVTYALQGNIFTGAMFLFVE